VFISISIPVLLTLKLYLSLGNVGGDAIVVMDSLLIASKVDGTKPIDARYFRFGFIFWEA